MGEGTGRTANLHTVEPVYDPKTGEHVGNVVRDVPVPLGKTKPRPRKEPFIMFTQRSLRLLNITGSQNRVLNLLASVRDRTTGQSRLLIREMADRLDMFESGVSRALIDMQRREIVFKEGTGVYRINNHIAYSGDNATDVTMDPEPTWTREEAHA